MSQSKKTLLALAIYNSWRRGDETIEMPSPAEIGATIDDAVNLLRKYDGLERRVERLKHGTVAQFKDAFIDELKRENAQLREWQAGVIANERSHHAERKEAIARAERAEAELANIRALANRRNKRDHAQDTTHQLVAALDQALDIAEANLAADAAKTEAAR